MTEKMSCQIRDGNILIGSDGHYWPKQPKSTGHKAFVKFIKEMKPRLVIYNGDALDASTISRHPPQGFQYNPTLTEGHFEK
jgi:hypothetical protein